MNNKTILVVDPDITMHRLIKSIVFNYGSSVFNAYNGKEGFSLISRLKPDLIIIEQNLPDIAGTEFVKVLRTRQIFSRVILLSSFFTKEILNVSSKLGIIQSIPKPPDTLLLQQWIIFALGQNPSVAEPSSQRSVQKVPISYRQPQVEPKPKNIQKNPKILAKLALREKIKEEKIKEEKIKGSSDFSESSSSQIGTDENTVLPKHDKNSNIEFYKKMSSRIERVLDGINSQGDMLIELGHSSLSKKDMLELKSSFCEFFEDESIKISEFDEIEAFLKKDEIIEKADSYYIFNISSDSMNVLMEMFPPVGGGKVIDESDVFKDIQRLGIVFGIDDQAIKRALNHCSFGTDQPWKGVIASGKLPFDGTDDRLVFHKKFQAAEQEKPDASRINFKNIINVCMVMPNDLIAEIERGIEGRNGIDIYGNEVLCKPGKKIELKAGENVTVDSFGCKFYSLIKGNMKFADSVISVSDYYLVDGDVDYSSGNIAYKGNVYIKGNVLDDFSVRADGDIIITGNVNAALVRATGDIKIYGGVVARDKGIVSSGGNVEIKFAEHAVIEANKNIIINRSSVFSNLYANARIIVKTGRLTGGNCFARDGIYINGDLGSNQGKTCVHVGNDFLSERQAENIKHEIKKRKDQLINLKQLMYSLKSNDCDLELLNEEEKSKIFSIFKKHREIQNVVAAFKERLDRLTDQALSDNFNFSAYIQARGELSRDTLIFFGTMQFLLKKDYNRVKIFFNKEKDDIETEDFKAEKIPDFINFDLPSEK
jgi:uncharacterized protein (DUF342 family)/DNA-binding response OmpR family regulator